VPKLERLSEAQRNSLLSHNVLSHDSAPWAPLRKALRECAVALVTTAGVHVRGDRPFTNADQTFRMIPSETPTQDIIMSHTSIGFDRTGVYQDLNLVFPVDRLRDMQVAGEVGQIGPNFYAFLGAQRSYQHLIEQSGPEVGKRLRDEGVDAVLLTGT